MHSLIESLFFPFELSVFYHIFLVMRSGLMEDKWFGQGLIPSNDQARK